MATDWRLASARFPNAMFCAEMSCIGEGIGGIELSDCFDLSDRVRFGRIGAGVRRSGEFSQSSSTSGADGVLADAAANVSCEVSISLLESGLRDERLPPSATLASAASSAAIGGISRPEADSGAKDARSSWGVMDKLSLLP